LQDWQTVSANLATAQKINKLRRLWRRINVHMALTIEIRRRFFEY
jgi:hypothetical protein